MDQTTHSRIVSFRWGIADDVLLPIADQLESGTYGQEINPGTYAICKADIIAVQNEAEGLLDELVQGAAP